MMRKNRVVYLCIWAITSIFVAESYPSDIQLKMDKSQELGKHEMMFASIASVCEGPDGNLYVLDRMEHKVFKFSPQGELVLTFGQKGQGPGDFQNPHRLTITPKSQLVVADEMYNLTFLTQQGHFVERVHLDSLLAASFIGEDRFYGWVWDQEHRSQVMVDRENNILEHFFQVPIRAFSASAPDESGRLVMFNYARDEFAPSLQFAHFGRYSAVGIGDRYDILILNDKGENTGHVRREIQPESFTKKEKAFLEGDIEDSGKERGWPRSVLRDLIKKIPDKKIFFTRVLLTDEHVFVFRTKKDITDDSGPVPVDVFAIKGKFLGSVHLPDIPLHISRDHIYFVRSDEQDNLFLEKAAFEVIQNENKERPTQD